ncbi:MAG: NDP-sugar synthase [Candidatus Bathyarchaeia archaeon]
MKALILAGGYATRLRPLSFTTPKQLLPMVDKPLLHRTVESLKEVGVDEVILAVNYLADSLKRRVGSRCGGVKIRYSREAKPLGTGGPIKKAEPMLRGEKVFLCLNGDILFQNNMRGLIQTHEKKGVTATIALREVEDPSRFGVAIVDNQMFVRGFIEKPKKGEVESRYINAGVYALSPEIFKHIPRGRWVSTETEVFPRLAERGELAGYPYKGGWFDVGRIEDYKEANWHLLERSFMDADYRGVFKVSKPVFIDSNVKIKEGASIGPYAVLGSNIHVDGNVSIERSILFNGVKVGRSTKISDAVLCDKVEVGENVVLKDVVLGEGVKVLDNVALTGQVNVCPHVTVRESLNGPWNVLS